MTAPTYPSRDERYYRLRLYLNSRFGFKVNKISLNPGYSCPNRDESGAGGCVYCLPEALVPRGRVKAMTITEQLMAGMEKVGKRDGVKHFIAHFQISTNTFAPIDELKKVYAEATADPRIVTLSVSTRPDCVGEPVLELLEAFAKEREVWLELGLQSAKDATLRAINRGHEASDFADAVKRATRRGLKVVAHVILGLPNETRDDMLATMAFIADLPVWGIKFHQLQIVRGTTLETRLRNKEPLDLLTLEEYTDLVVDCLEALPPEMVVHRLVGDTLDEFHIAPRWGPDKFKVTEKIKGRLKERSTRQGARYKTALRATL